MEVQPQDPRELTEKEWIDTYNQLRYIIYKKYGHNQMVKGKLDDIIQEALLAIFDGKRRWPPLDAQGRIKDMTILCFLCHTVRSKVSHMLEQQKKIVSLDSTSEGGASEMITNPQQSSDQRARFNELRSWILKAVLDDPILSRLATLLINIPDLKLKEIAKRLGLSETEAHNAKRRLSRRLKKMA